MKTRCSRPIALFAIAALVFVRLALDLGAHALPTASGSFLALEAPNLQVGTLKTGGDFQKIAMP